MIGMRGTALEMRGRAHELLEEAKKHEAEGDFSGAADLARKAAAAVRRVADCELVVRDQARLYAKARELEGAAEKLAKGQRVYSDGPAGTGSIPAEDEYRASVDELIFRAPVTWDDIGGMEDVKRTLKYMFGLTLAKAPEDVHIETATRVLFYGTSGTGKTLLAAACSNMLGATFFSVKASDLLSKYFGESTKLVSALFARARSEADTGVSVIFIDEIDALTQSRDRQDQSGAELRIVSTLLAELDGMREKGEQARVIIIAATNKPWMIDDAILERFEKHIYVGLPDQAARAEIFKVHIGGTGLHLGADTSYQDLAARTDGYSGRLIRNACKEAVARMVAELNAQVPRHVDQGSIRGYELAIRPLSRADFEFALKKIRPSGDKEKLRKYQTWAERIGGDAT